MIECACAAITELTKNTFNYLGPKWRLWLMDNVVFIIFVRFVYVLMNYLFKQSFYNTLKSLTYSRVQTVYE